MSSILTRPKRNPANTKISVVWRSPKWFGVYLVKAELEKDLPKVRSDNLTKVKKAGAIIAVRN